MEQFIAITINIKVESDLPIDEVVGEFSTETDYNFSDTENVKVVNTEILECWERDFGGN